MNVKNTAWAAALALGIFTGAGAGEPAEAPKTRAWYRTWFEHLKKGLTESSVRSHYQKSRVTAVAAVRGAKQEAMDADAPAWIGGPESRKAAQTRKERAEFEKSVDFILKGEFKEGLAGLEAFEKAHPKSGLLPEVRQARENAKLLQDEPAAAAPAVEAPAPESEKK